MTNRLTDIYRWSILLLSSLFLFIASYLIPQNDWDLVGHLGSAFSFEYTGSKDIHQATYKELSQSLSPDDLQEIMMGNAEREIWSNDAEAFVQVLPFYQPRVLLTLPTWISFKLGYSPVEFIRIITSLSVAFGVIFFGLIFMNYMNRLMFLIFPVVVLIAGPLETARFEGADSISFLLVSILFLLISRRNIACLIPLIILPLSRSDMVILVVCLVPLLMIVFWTMKVKVVLAILLSISSYYFVNQYFGNYGWSTQFYVVHVEYLARPAVVDINITKDIYLDALASGLILLLYDKVFLFFVVCSLLVTAKLIEVSNYKWINNLMFHDISNMAILYWMAFGSIIFVGIHFIVFPLVHIRYFSAQYLYLGLLLLSVFRSRNETADVF